MQVLIPTLGCHRALSLTLESYRLTSPKMRICVVAANASDELRALLKRFKVDPLYLPDNLGFPGNVNAGLDHFGDDDHTIISNDDVVMLTPGWKDVVDENIRGKGVAAIGAVSNYVLGHQLFTAPGPRLGVVETLSWFWIAVSKFGLKKVGRLDEEFGLGLSDDLDWSLRAKEKGMKLLLDRRLFVWHWGSQTIKDLANYHQLDRENKELLKKKHPDTLIPTYG